MEDFSKLRKKAESGDASAMLALARAYHRSEGVERDVSEALDWYLEAAFSGSAEAMLAIAEMYRTGDGLPRDVAKSMEWYEKSGLDAGADAVVDFADAYYSGGFGVPKDLTKAYELYRKAAVAGNVGAMARAADMLCVGDGVDRDCAKAVELYRKAADAGNVGAMVRAADMLCVGDGVDRDCAKAVELYHKAADAGDMGAMEKMKKMKHMMFAEPGFVFVEMSKDVADRDFYICDHPVTQDEYQRIMGANPSRFSGKDNPVENVSWYDCIEYCNRRSRAEGLEECYSGGDDIRCDFSKNGYRLPTESEWEWAARGGFKSGGHVYSGSNDIGEAAWYVKNSGRTTHPVKQKNGNELGIYDMSGNVWEWCWDWYDEAGVKSPYGPVFGSYRVYRGGSWSSRVDYCSLSYRYYWYPSDANCDLGFRLARSARD